MLFEGTKLLEICQSHGKKQSPFMNKLSVLALNLEVLLYRRLGAYEVLFVLSFQDTKP